MTRLAIVALGILATLTHAHLLGGGDEHRGATLHRDYQRRLPEHSTAGGVSDPPPRDLQPDLHRSTSVEVPPPAFIIHDIGIHRIRWGSRPEIRNVYRKGR